MHIYHQGWHGLDIRCGHDCKERAHLAMRCDAALGSSWCPRSTTIFHPGWFSLRSLNRVPPNGWFWHLSKTSFSVLRSVGWSLRSHVKYVPKTTEMLREHAWTLHFCCVLGPQETISTRKRQLAWFRSGRTVCETATIMRSLCYHKCWHLHWQLASLTFLSIQNDRNMFSLMR